MAKTYVTIHEDVNNFLSYVGRNHYDAIGAILAELSKYDNSNTLLRIFFAWVPEEFDRSYWGNFFSTYQPKSIDDVNAYGLNVYNKAEERVWRNVGNLMKKVFKVS